MTDISKEDRYRAMQMVEQLSSSADLYVTVQNGDPVSKQRPEFGRGRAYTPKATSSAEDALAYQLRSLPKLLGNVVVVALFYRSNRQRIDVDNLLKLVLDASTKGLMWEDDSQVTALVGVLDLDPDHPRTVLAYGHHVSALARGDSAKVSCEACGQLFLPSGNRRRETARWCSRECRMTLAEPVSCTQCGEPFKRRSGNQKLCSETCRREAMRVYNRNRGREVRVAQGDGS